MSNYYKNLMKERILYDLQMNAGSSITAEILASVNNINETSDTCPATRGFIRELIDEGALIGSTSKGYHMMTTGKEVQQCLNALLKRTMGINKRIQSIYDAAQVKGIL